MGNTPVTSSLLGEWVDLTLTDERFQLYLKSRNADGGRGCCNCNYNCNCIFNKGMGIPTLPTDEGECDIDNMKEDSCKVVESQSKIWCDSCKVFVEVDQFVSHYNDQCLVECPMRCGKGQVSRSYLQNNHIHECPRLHIPCPNRWRGCSIRENRDNMRVHVTQQCPCQPVKCPNRNCSKLDLRGRMEDHRKVCEHEELTCRNGCGTVMTRKLHKDHMEKHCPDAMVSCVATDIGCDFVGKRKAMYHHSALCPLLRVRPIFLRLKQENDDLRAELSFLRERTHQQQGVVYHHQENVYN